MPAYAFKRMGSDEVIQVDVIFKFCTVDAAFDLNHICRVLGIRRSEALEDHQFGWISGAPLGVYRLISYWVGPSELTRLLGMCAGTAVEIANFQTRVAEIMATPMAH